MSLNKDFQMTNTKPTKVIKNIEVKVYEPL